MAYTLSNGLRDREYAKFTKENIGSFTGINVSNILKSYDFGTTTASTGAGSGLFGVWTSYELNGMLKAVVVGKNNYNDNGSLYLVASGIGIDIWQLISGTQTSNVAVSGAYLVRGSARTTENINLSGTVGNGVWTDIPLYGFIGFVGSGLGDSKSGLGLTIIYQ